MSWRLNTLRNRLVLLIFAITAAAIGFVYLYVVPQLESSLTAEKLRRLERLGDEQSPRLDRGAARAAPRSRRSTTLVQEHLPGDREPGDAARRSATTPGSRSRGS